MTSTLMAVVLHIPLHQLSLAIAMLARRLAKKGHDTITEHDLKVIHRYLMIKQH